MTLVQKMLAKNIDEIDTRGKKHLEKDSLLTKCIFYTPISFFIQKLLSGIKIFTNYTKYVTDLYWQSEIIIFGSLSTTFEASNL